MLTTGCVAASADDADGGWTRCPCCSSLASGESSAAVGSQALEACPAGGAPVNVRTVDQSPLRKRAARFGWLTFGLATLAIGLLVVAAVRLIQDGPTIQAEAVLVPLNVDPGTPAARSCRPALLVASTFVGLAGLQTAAVMRVLAPDRHVPPPPPSGVRRARHLMVGAFDTGAGSCRSGDGLAGRRASHTRGTARRHEGPVHGADPRSQRGGHPRADLGVAGTADTSPGPRDRRGRQQHRWHRRRSSGAPGRGS